MSSRKQPWTEADMPSQQGRIILITGTKGLARHTAHALARAGAEVVLAGYQRSEGEATLARIRADIPFAKIQLEDLDLTDFDSIQSFVERMQGQYPRLDGLLNNAGMIAVPSRRLTKNGFELQMGTNFLGHFALTGRLMPLLRQAADPRVVTVSALAANNVSIDFDDLQSEHDYKPMKAYGRSKLADLIFALELHRRSVAGDWGISSIAVHPGLALDREDQGADDKAVGSITQLLIPILFQRAASGVLPFLFALTSPAARSGQYYGPDRLFEIRGHPTEAKVPKAARDLAMADRLWRVANELTNAEFEKFVSAAQPAHAVQD